MSDEFDDFDDHDCWNCSGEGFVYDCFEEYACIDPESGCDMCGRRCDVCNPAKRDPDLDAALAAALGPSPA